MESARTAPAKSDQLRAATRAAQLARVLAEAEWHLAEVTERRARHMTVHSAMHLRAARRLRLQSGAHRLEARRQESAAARIRDTMEKSA